MKSESVPTYIVRMRKLPLLESITIGDNRSNSPYTGDLLEIRPILPITIFGGSSIEISMGTQLDQVTIRYDTDLFEVTNPCTNRDIICVSATNNRIHPGERLVVVTVEFNRPFNRARIGDIYQFSLVIRGIKIKTLAVTVTIMRSKSSRMTIENLRSQGQVGGQIHKPIIKIQGQTNILGDDLAEMVFTIFDAFTYYNRRKLDLHSLYINRFIKSQLKQTTFKKCCDDISLFRVLEGTGQTAIEKCKNLYLNDSVIESQVEFYEFFHDKLTLYAMAKYILFRLLTGKFNIKFLLRKYDKKFFKDLASSRFWRFKEVFFGPDQLNTYNRFFKFDIGKTPVGPHLIKKRELTGPRLASDLDEKYEDQKDTNSHKPIEIKIKKLIKNRSKKKSGEKHRNKQMAISN